MNENLVNNTVTLGTVVDVNDPYQLGRIRVMCPQWNDNIKNNVIDIPWAKYATPFGGVVAEGKRGPDDTGNLLGPVAYGIWAIPKVGADVLVMCVDGNPNNRYWIACVFPPFMEHTLPHGRYSTQTNESLPKNGAPEGPFDSYENPILPLFNNLLNAFGTDRVSNFEWKTRGADYSVTALDKSDVDNTMSFIADDKPDNNTSKERQGYETSRQRPELQSSINDGNFDSQTYAFTSPGFHSLSMDDRKKNCRIRLRSTAGNQIILDDTNERIFVSTANGKSWIEMDQAGNIDIHSDGRISMHSTRDMNFTTDKSFRVKAKEGIHLQSDTDIRMQSEEDIHIRSAANVRLNSEKQTHISATKDIYLLGKTIHEKATGGVLNIQASSHINILAGGNIIETGSKIHMNGPPATPATAAIPADNFYAYATKRVPFNLAPNLNEMWGRVCMDPELTDSDDESNATNDYYERLNHEYDYDDPDIGHVECGTYIHRGPYWRR